MAILKSGVLCAISFLAIHGVWAQSDTINKACSNAKYKDFCISSLSKAPGASQADLTQLSVIAVDLGINEEKTVSGFIKNLLEKNPSVSALKDCSDLLKDTRDQLKDSQSKLKQLSNENFSQSVPDAQTWLSAGASNQGTCVSGLEESNAAANLVSSVKDKTNDLNMLISDALDVLNTLKQQGHTG